MHEKNALFICHYKMKTECLFVIKATCMKYYLSELSEQSIKRHLYPHIESRVDNIK